MYKRYRKYGNKKVKYDSITFDSKKEYVRYLELKAMEEEGIISELRVHVTYTIFRGFKDQDGKKHRDITYTPDFVYLKDDVIVCEDLKSVATQRDPVYRMKKKMFIYVLLRMQERDGKEYKFNEVVR